MKSSNSNRPRSRRAPVAAGFSLMELIVVVSILAMLTAAVLPVFGPALRGAKVDNAFQDVLATMRYAQDAAVSQGVEHRVYFDEQENAYWLERLVGYDQGDKLFEAMDEHVGEWRQLPQGFEFDRISGQRESRGLYFLAFYPTGARDQGEVRMRNTAENIRGYAISTKSSGRSASLDSFDVTVPEQR